MASQLFDFRTVFFESGVFSHTGMSQERWDLRAVFRNRQQVEVDWVHWQGRWPVVGRVWGLRYGPGLDKKMFQFCLSLVLHRPRRVSPSFLCCQGQDVRAQAGSTGAGSRHSSHLTWCHLSPQQWVQLLCPNPGVPLHTGPAPPPLWASSIRQRACLQQMIFRGSLLASPTNSHNTSAGEAQLASLLALCMDLVYSSRLLMVPQQQRGAQRANSENGKLEGYQRRQNSWKTEKEFSTRIMNVHEELTEDTGNMKWD